MAGISSLTIAIAGWNAARRRPGSPWMPTPISISLGPISKVGTPASGTVQLLNATPIDAVQVLTRSPRCLQVDRSAPRSAAAPTIFSTTSVPATPRRPAVWPAASMDTSSLTSTEANSLSIMSMAIWKFITSPA